MHISEAISLVYLRGRQAAQSIAWRLRSQLDPGIFSMKLIPRNIIIHDMMMSHNLRISNQCLFNNSSIFTQLLISPQLTLPEQPRMWHTTTALNLGPWRTQVIMFGGCPKFESGKSSDAEQKLAKTTVLDFGEQSTHTQHFSIHLLAISASFQ